MAHHSKPANVLHSKEMMMTLLMGHVDSEMEWAIKEPMKLPNCMQALYKQNTRYKGMRGMCNKRVCTTTLIMEMVLMKNAPNKAKR